MEILSPNQVSQTFFDLNDQDDDGDNLLLEKLATERQDNMRADLEELEKDNYFDR